MDTIQGYYQESIKHNHYSLLLLIDYLVKERKVLKMTDKVDKLSYYLQPRFQNKMNEYLTKYERVKKSG